VTSSARDGDGFVALAIVRKTIAAPGTEVRVGEGNAAARVEKIAPYTETA